MASIWAQTKEGTWQQDCLPANQPVTGLLGAADVQLVQLSGRGKRGFALLVAEVDNAYVSGNLVLGGIHLLRHRDEIILRSRRWYYSAESQPEIVMFQLQEGSRRPKCPVCRMNIEDGQMSVSCPGCNAVYHQSDACDDRPAKPCYSYRPQCVCGHPTSLSGEPGWQPETEDLTYDLL